jgi:hypothetical protein
MPFSQDKVHMEFRIIGVDFDVTDQLLIRSFAFIRYWRKKWEYNNNQLFVDSRKACD